MATMSINEMRKWLKNNDPVYGGHKGWIDKVSQWSDMQVLAVYRSRQEAVYKKKAKEKVSEAQLQGLPMTLQDVNKEEGHNIDKTGQLTLMDVFGDVMKEAHYKNCERISSL